VLDQAWPTKWDPEHGGFSQSRAWLHRDGKFLTYQFFCSPREYTDYPSADVLESETAVVVLPTPVQLGAVFRRAYAQRREVTATLRGVLGSRVLIEPSGWAVRVEAADPSNAP